MPFAIKKTKLFHTSTASVVAFTEQYQKTVVRLLKAYKANRCLWNSKDVNYVNKRARYEAYMKLLAIWRTVEPEAELEIVKKKLDYLRTCYRRERKKCFEENGHKPTLWYYKYLLFLDADNLPEEYYQASDTDDSEEEKADIPRKKPIYRFIFSKNVNKAADETDSSEEPYELENTESIDSQLNELSDHQRCLAKKLISQVLLLGKNEELTVDTSLFEMDKQGEENSSEITPEDVKNKFGHKSPSCSHFEDETVNSYESRNLKTEFSDETESAVSFLEDFNETCASEDRKKNVPMK